MPIPTPAVPAASPRRARSMPWIALAAGIAAAAPLAGQQAPPAARRPAPASRAAAAAPAAPGRVDPALLAELKYRMVGPARGGRVTAVTGVGQEPRTFYFGSTGGGVWKTTDAGMTWNNVSDASAFEAASIGALDVADSDPNVIYVGTGSEAIRSNVSIGRGVYRSADAGRTWRFVGLRDAGQIGAVVVHPANPDVAYVAALGNPFAPGPERGVYRTRDGGRSWQKVLFVSDSTGAVDLELQPGNPSVVYASMWRGERKPWTIISGAGEGGVYKSADGGDTWAKLGGGLPNGVVGKSDLAVSAAAPNRVYALVEAKPGSGLYRSDDAGQSWTLVNPTPQLITRPFYYTNVDADPTNADVVYVGTEGFYKSTDGGRSFRPMRTPHGDNHDMWINPRDGSLLIQSNDGGANVSLDGGRSWSTQYNQPTAEIYQVYVDEQYPYRLYGAQQDNSTVIVPSLPLTSGRPDDPMQEWRQGPGCETGPIIPHPTSPDTVYGSCKGQFSRMSLRTGQERQYWVGAQSLYGNPGAALTYRFQRVSPMEVSPHDPRTIYYGSQYLHRTRDEGGTWERISPDLTANDPRYRQTISGEPITIDVTGEESYATLYAIEESPLAPGVIWTGANDGPVWVTRDAGRTWKNVTPPDLPPGGRVQSIDASPHRPGSAYVSVLRYLLGDFRPYVYKTDDYGATWTRLADGTNGIPADAPTRVVREDPDRAGLLYAGTEFGMYVSFDDGRTWQSLQLNLPVTPITDLKVHRKDLVIATQGRSFWILDDLTPLHELSDRVLAARAHLVRPREAVRWHYRGGFGGVEGNRAPLPSEPRYPQAGAMIDYWLGGPAGDAGVAPAVTLEILDAGGSLVRRFSSTSGLPAGAGGGGFFGGAMPEEGGEGGGGAATPDSARMQERSATATATGGTASAPPRADPGTGATRLTARPGLNRFIWDLTLPGPWAANARQSGRNGPMAAPGTYSVRLTVEGTAAMTQPLVVRADPRALRDGITPLVLREQLAHNLRVRDLVSDVSSAVERVRSARRRLRGAAGGPAADTLRRLDSLERRLATPPVRYSQPGLQAHITYLYGMTLGADQRVGRDAVERYQALRKEMDAVEAELRALLGSGQTLGGQE